MKRDRTLREHLERALSTIWEEHKVSFQPHVLVNEVHPRAVLPIVGGAIGLLLVMGFVPSVREFTGFDNPWLPIALLVAAGSLSLVQWVYWDRQRVAHVMCVVDNSCYCLAFVAVMLDTVSPIKYVWALVYAQCAAHYGNRYAFSWPLLLAISVLPFIVTVAFHDSDYGLLALTLFGAMMFVVNSTTTRHARKVERERERYRSAYELTDKVATESLDIAIATSMAEVGNFLHELRNASTPLIGNLMVLKEHEDRHPEIRDSVESLERSTERVNELIENLLLSMKRRVSLERAKFMLSDVLNDHSLCSGLMPDCRKKVVLVGPVTPFQMSGNPEHLDAAIGNLVQNAVSAGASRVEISSSIDGGMKRATISLVDDGPGIPEELLAGLFQPGSMSPQGEGHGLGLPLSKRLVEVLGGTLKLAKTGSSGTSFEIVIPGRYLARGQDKATAA